MYGTEPQSETPFERDQREQASRPFGRQIAAATFSAGLFVAMAGVVTYSATPPSSSTTAALAEENNTPLARPSNLKAQKSGPGTPVATGLASSLNGASLCWTDKTTLEVNCMDSTGDIATYADSLENPRDVVLDAASSKLIFTDMDSGGVYSVDYSSSGLLSSSKPTALYEGLEEPQLLAIDDACTVYWTDEDAGIIRRGRADASDAVADVVAVTPDVLVTISLSDCGSYLYWLDYGASEMYRAKVDSDFGEADVETLLTAADGLDGPKYMDVADSQIFWCDGACTSIKSTSLEATGPITTHAEDLDMSIKALVVDAAAEYVYFTDGTNYKISRMSLASGEIEDIVTDLGSPMGLTLIEA